MKNLGLAILLIGLVLGGYSLTMDVGIDVPAKDYGYGVSTPAMKVANADKIAQRQNMMTFSGILSVVGAILLGFGSMQQRAPARSDDAHPKLMSTTEGDADSMRKPVAPPGSFSICSKCRHMGDGDDSSCAKCGAVLQD